MRLLSIGYVTVHRRIPKVFMLLKSKLFLLFLLISHAVAAQQGKAIYDVTQLGLIIPEGERPEFNELVFGAIPTTYLKSSAVENSDSNTRRVIGDVYSIKQLGELASTHKYVEMVQINVHSLTDLTLLSELSGLEEFRSCKYLYLNCSFEICPRSADTKCEKDQLLGYLQKLLQTDLIIFYSSNSDQ